MAATIADFVNEHQIKLKVLSGKPQRCSVKLTFGEKIWSLSVLAVK